MIRRYLNALSLIPLMIGFTMAEGFLGPDITLCTSQCVELSIFASPNGVFPVWSTGDSTTSIMVCHNPDIPEQIIWVEVQEDDASGDPPTYYYDTIKITMVTTMPPIAPPFDFVETCIGSCITLLGPSGGIKYIWNPYTGLNEFDTARVCINIPKIKYKVTAITDTVNNCRYDYFINVKAAIKPTDTMLHAITLCKDSCMELKAPSGGHKYNWSPAIWLNDAKIKNPVICPEGDTTYIISTITDTTIDCQYVDTLTVSVNENADCGMTGIDNYLLQEGFRLFPNPSKDNITIYLEGAMIYKEIMIVLYDLQGNKIYESNTSINEKKQLNLESFAQGIYTICISDRDRLYYSKKLMIQ